MEKEIDDIQNAGIRIMEEVSDSLDMDNHISDVDRSISEDVGEVIELCSISPLHSFAEAIEAIKDTIYVKGNLAVLPDGKMITVNELDDDKKQLLEECNESLYLAIFDKTIVDNLNRKESKKRFMEDCIKIVNSL